MQKKLNEEIKKYENEDVSNNIKFIEKFKNKDNNISSILESIKDMEDDQKAKDIIKNHENNYNKKILKSEKYKLIKHLGNIHKSFVDVFNIDSVSFDNIQDKTKLINNSEIMEYNSPDVNIESFTSINIYLRESEGPFTEKEINEKKIDIIKSPKLCLY